MLALNKTANMLDMLTIRACVCVYVSWYQESFNSVRDVVRLHTLQRGNEAEDLALPTFCTRT
jgi:hypothetical protein